MPETAHEPKIKAVAEKLGFAGLQVSALEGGAANSSFRLRDARHDYVLRIQGAAAVGLGASRASEHAMQSLAAAAGLAPQIILAQPSEGIVVTRHITGRTPGLADFRTPGMLRRAGAWIARLHALDPPPGLPAIDFGARAADYLANLDLPLPGLDAAALDRRLAGHRAVIPPPARHAPCHHDLHHRNFVDTGDALLAVDWEYAGPGDHAADLAACIRYHDLDSAGIDALLGGYGEDSPALRARIAELGWIFDCLWFGWNASAAAAGLPVDGRQQAQLAARLAR